ncbi:large ribosomal subunit protein bL35m [Aegotheles albertisi]
MAAARGAVAGLLRRWAPWAARCPGVSGRPLCGLSAPAVRAPAAAPLWRPRLPWGAQPGGGSAPLLSSDYFQKKMFHSRSVFSPVSGVFFSVTSLLPSILQQPVRALTYYSLRKGKRKSVKSVVKRFLRLHNGLWVRRKAGYKKRLWKKSAAQRKRLRELVLCNRTQCKLLDKMTTSFWKRRNWYVDDPYQKYHDRTNLRV